MLFLFRIDIYGRYLSKLNRTFDYNPLKKSTFIEKFFLKTKINAIVSKLKRVTIYEAVISFQILKSLTIELIGERHGLNLFR